MFSLNQTTQMFVGIPTSENGAVANKGDIQMVTKNDCFYFVYKNANGDIRRSDLIPKKNIMHHKHVLKTDDVKYEKKVVFTPGTIKECKTYILRLTIKNAFSISDKDMYWKEAAFVAASGATVSNMLDSFKEQIEKSLKRDYSKWVTITKSGDTLVFEGVSEDWELGKYPLKITDFTVEVFSVGMYGANEEFGTVEEVELNEDKNNLTAIPNSKTIADMEHFYSIGLGNIYNGMDYPNNINMKLMADGDKANGYNVLTIHYYYEGANHAVQKSEKTIIIASTESLAGFAAALDPASFTVHTEHEAL